MYFLKELGMDLDVFCTIINFPPSDNVCACAAPAHAVCSQREHTHS